MLVAPAEPVEPVTEPSVWIFRWADGAVKALPYLNSGFVVELREWYHEVRKECRLAKSTLIVGCVRVLCCLLSRLLLIDQDSCPLAIRLQGSEVGWKKLHAALFNDDESDATVEVTGSGSKPEDWAPSPCKALHSSGPQ